MSSSKKQHVHASNLAALLKQRQTIEKGITASQERLERASMAVSRDLKVTLEGRTGFVTMEKSLSLNADLQFRLV